MLLFWMIPVSLLAFTVAIGPVLVMTLVEHHARRRAAVAPAAVIDNRREVIDAAASSRDDRHLTGVR